MTPDPFQEFSDRNDQSRQMETMLMAAAAKAARQGATDWTVKIDPEKLDFSMFGHDPQITDFSNQQLFMSNLRQYAAKEFENDAFMDQPAESEKRGKNPVPEKLKMLGFAVKNHADYDGPNNKLTLADGGLEIDLIENSSPEIKPKGLFGNKSSNSLAQKIYDDRRSMVGFVRARFKLNHNVPHMIANPHNGTAKLPTHELVAQKLETEGGADHFHIFASPTYQADVLYIFTPDVLNAMDKNGADFAYKFYDNEVEIYAPDSVLKNGEDLRDLILTAINLTKQINKQAARYRDERATSGAQILGNLAPRGRRMDSNISFWSIAIVAAVALFIMWIVVELTLPLIFRT
ncbi:hypothetical protein FWG95_04060 [Candidatus Saccharibacteria bacterium]|nr:hypothetical protein [Candidatus Saccharibacteria bacterium]